MTPADLTRLATLRDGAPVTRTAADVRWLPWPGDQIACPAPGVGVIRVVDVDGDRVTLLDGLGGWGCSVEEWRRLAEGRRVVEVAG